MLAIHCESRSPLPPLLSASRSGQIDLPQSIWQYREVCSNVSNGRTTCPTKNQEPNSGRSCVSLRRKPAQCSVSIGHTVQTREERQTCPSILQTINLIKFHKNQSILGEIIALNGQEFGWSAARREEKIGRRRSPADTLFFWRYFLAEIHCSRDSENAFKERPSCQNYSVRILQILQCRRHALTQRTMKRAGLWNQPSSSFSSAKRERGRLWDSSDSELQSEPSKRENHHPKK